MKIITTFEHTFIPYTDIHPEIDQIRIDTLQNNIEQNFDGVLNIELKGLKIKGFVGVIKLDETIIEVLPKFYKNSEDISINDKKSIYRNLYYMINKSMKLPTYQMDFQNFDTSKGTILDFFIFIFLQNLYRALIKGTYKTYIKEEINSKYIKGKILVNKTIMRNILGLNVFSETDKYTEDNIVNQIFKYVVKNMHNSTGWVNNKRIAKQILLFLTDIQDIYVHDSLFSNIKRDRLLGDFEYFLSFSRFYINNQTMTNHNSTDNSSFIFNIAMADVYQDYISELLKEYSSEIVDPYQLRAQQSDHHLVYTSGNKGKLKLIPDIIIQSNNLPLVIIDTKYKLLERNSPRNGVRSSDLYQMFGYYHKYNKPQIILLYPQYKEEFNDQYYFYKENIGPLNVVTIDLNDDIFTKSGELALVNRLKEIIFPIN